MLGILGALIFGGAYAVDSVQKGIADNKSRQESIVNGEPYYLTHDHKYIYKPTGEKCWLTTARVGSSDTAYVNCLKTIGKNSRIAYIFPITARRKEQLIAARDSWLRMQEMRKSMYGDYSYGYHKNLAEFNEILRRVEIIKVESDIKD